MEVTMPIYDQYGPSAAPALLYGLGDFRDMLSQELTMENYLRGVQALAPDLMRPVDQIAPAVQAYMQRNPQPPHPAPNIPALMTAIGQAVNGAPATGGGKSFLQSLGAAISGLGLQCHPDIGCWVTSDKGKGVQATENRQQRAQEFTLREQQRAISNERADAYLRLAQQKEKRLIKSPKQPNARESVLRKLSEGKEPIKPGEADTLLLNITGIVQRDDVANAVARHNQRLIQNQGQQARPGQTSTAPGSAKPPVVRLPQNKALRIPGRRYKHPKDLNMVVIWDGEKVVAE